MTVIEYLQSLDACDPAVTWAKEHGGTLAELWRDCQRGDWLLWFAARVEVGRHMVVLAVADCAELAIPYCRDEKVATRCKGVLEIVRRWARNEASDNELREARRTAITLNATVTAAHAAIVDAAIVDAIAYAVDAIADAIAYDIAIAAIADAIAYAAADADADALIEMRGRTAAAVRAAIPWSAASATVAAFSTFARTASPEEDSVLKIVAGPKTEM